MVKTIFRSASRFLELDAPSRGLVLFIALLLPIFWLKVKVLGECRLRPYPRMSSMQVDREPSSLEAACLLGRMVNTVAHHVLPPDSCLSRSLLLLWLLRRRGIAGNLRIGVRFDNGHLHSHAWVDIAGHPVNDTHDVAERFTPFSFPFTAFPWPLA